MLRYTTEQVNNVYNRHTNGKRYKKSKSTQHHKTKHKKTYRKFGTAVQEKLEPACFSCSYCDEYFSQEQLLRRHIKLHSSYFQSKYAGNEEFKKEPEQKTVECNTDSDEEKYEYGEHFIYKACKELSQFQHNSSAELNNHNTKGKAAEMILCKKRGKNYSNDKSHISHKLIHTCSKQFKCRNCGQSFSTDTEYTKHRDEVHFKSWKCDSCNNFFATETGLQSHLKLCTNKKSNSFTCYLCSKKFKLKTNLKSHIESDCGINPQYTCKICGKAFMTRGTLGTHKQIHLGKKTFLCRFCGKNFHLKVAMQRHELSHTGEKPFVCEIKDCGKAFAHRESLITHNTTHTGLRPYMCENCGSTFSCIGNFIKHKKTHNRNLKIASPKGKLKENISSVPNENYDKSTFLQQNYQHFICQTSNTSSTCLPSGSATNNRSKSEPFGQESAEEISEDSKLNQLYQGPQHNVGQLSYTNYSESLENKKSLPINEYEGAYVPGAEGMYLGYNAPDVSVPYSVYCPQNYAWNEMTSRVNSNENGQVTQNCFCKVPEVTEKYKSQLSTTENFIQITKNCEKDLGFTLVNISSVHRELDLHDNISYNKTDNQECPSKFPECSIPMLQNDSNEKFSYTANSLYDKNISREISSSVNIHDATQKNNLECLSETVISNRNSTKCLCSFNHIQNNHSSMINKPQVTDNSECSLSSSENGVGENGIKLSTSYSIVKNSNSSPLETDVLNHISGSRNQSELLASMEVRNIKSDTNENDNGSAIDENIKHIVIKAEVKLEVSDFIENKLNVEENGCDKTGKNENFLYSDKSENEYDNNSLSLQNSKHLLLDNARKQSTKSNYLEKDTYKSLKKSSQSPKLSKNVSCPCCSKKFNSVYSLNAHKKVHKNRHKKEIHKCHSCDKSYLSKSCLLKHELLHKTQKHELVHEAACIFGCKLCKKTFSTKWKCEKHKLVEHRNNDFVCYICKHTFSSAKNLTLHMNIHTGIIDKTYNCYLCGKHFKQKGNLRVHLNSKCGTFPQYVCKICQKSFMSPGSLKTHTMIHLGNKTFLCRFCGKGFRLKIAMQRHELIHTGEKPYVCTVCGKAFAHRESLVTHNTIHTGIRPYMCEECGSTFSCCGNLIKHRVTHNKKKAQTDENIKCRR